MPQLGHVNVTSMKQLLSLLAILLLAQTATAQTVTRSGQNLVINTNGKFVVETADGSSSFQIGGRLQWDYNLAEKNDVVDEDALDIRRARLYAAFETGNWYYKAQFNIGNGNGGTPEDLYIRYSGLPGGWSATLGHQNEPFGLNQMTSSKDISMLERSAAAEAYSFGRSDGLLLSNSFGASTISAGVFEDDSSINSFAFTTRGTHALNLDNGDLVHLGLDYSNRGNDTTNTGLEIAWVTGPMHLQAEHYWSDSAGTDMSGYYIQAGYILTGESLPYSGGAFKRVSSSGTAGAWEIVARYESGDANYSDIELGNTDATALGVGLNYYLNGNIRMGVGYTQGEDNNSSDEGSEWRARLQFSF